MFIKQKQSLRPYATFNAGGYLDLCVKVGNRYRIPKSEIVRFLDRKIAVLYC